MPEAMSNPILEYKKLIDNGNIVAGKNVKLAYKWIADGFANGWFYYDAYKADDAIQYIEHFCHHAEGPLAPGKIKLELWQKALIASIFGIVDKEGLRQFREVFIVMGRKNGKTLLASAIASYVFYIDPEYGKRIYFASPELKQAKQCYGPFSLSIQKEPCLRKRTKKRKDDLFIEKTNSTANMLAFNGDKSDGLNISLVVADEVGAWSAYQGTNFYEVLSSSFGARKQPLLLSISTANRINDGPYDTLMDRAMNVLLGRSEERRLLPIIYMIDDIAKWDDIEELKKANPNMGVSVKVQYFIDKIKVAHGNAKAKSEFIIKFCNIKQSVKQAWLSMEDVNFSRKPYLLSGNTHEIIDPELFRDMYCVGGVDLGQTTDLTCETILFEIRGEFYVISHFWMPEGRLQEAMERDKIPYDKYVARGELTLTDGNTTNFEYCYKWFADMCETYQLHMQYIGYDRWSSFELVNKLKNRFGEEALEDVWQGFNLTPVLAEFEGHMRDHKVHIGENNLLTMHLLDSAVKIDDEKEHLNLVKISREKHIDGTASLIDAFCVRQQHQSDVGMLLRNERAYIDAEDGG